MCNISKSLTLMLVLSIAISSLIVLELRPADAQSTYKPSVPEFTVKLVAHPYDVAPTTTSKIDSYTGQEIITTTPGYHMENKSIEITIKNQPVTANSDAEGHTINIYYNVRVRGHFAEEWEWKELFSPYAIQNAREGISWTGTQSPIQSSSGNTVIACSADYAEGAQVDFQVQALQGYFTKYYPIIADAYGWHFTGQLSSWSGTKTIEIGEAPAVNTPSPIMSTPTSSPYNPTATASVDSSQPQTTETISLTTYIATVIVCIVIIAALTVLLFRRKRK